MAGVKFKSGFVKRSVSFSPLVNQWADELAQRGGFESFSAFLADLVRKAKESEGPIVLPDPIPKRSKELNATLKVNRVEKKLVREDVDAVRSQSASGGQKTAHAKDAVRPRSSRQSRSST